MFISHSLKTTSNLENYTSFFFYKKTMFLSEPQFSSHSARNQDEIFLVFFFLTFISLFSLIIHLI